MRVFKGFTNQFRSRYEQRSQHTLFTADSEQTYLCSTGGMADSSIKVWDFRENLCVMIVSLSIDDHFDWSPITGYLRARVEGPANGSVVIWRLLSKVLECVHGLGVEETGLELLISERHDDHEEGQVI